MASRSQGVANDHGIACQKMMADPTRQKASVATHRLDGTNIAILANGSRGDVQPFVALASHMEGMGCNVLILTNLNHVNFVQQSGLQAVAATEDSAKGLEGFAHRMATGEKNKERENRRVGQRSNQISYCFHAGSYIGYDLRACTWLHALTTVEDTSNESIFATLER